MEDMFFLRDGKKVAPKEEQEWRLAQKHAFDLANDAIVQMDLAKEMQAIADGQATKAREAKENADMAAEDERRLKQAYRDALDKASSSSR